MRLASVKNFMQITFNVKKTGGKERELESARAVFNAGKDILISQTLEKREILRYFFTKMVDMLTPRQFGSK